MKEWEKWFEKSDIEWYPSFPGFTFGDTIKTLKITWKAALEWALTQKHLDIMGCGKNIYMIDADDIEKELND